MMALANELATAVYTPVSCRQYDLSERNARVFRPFRVGWRLLSRRHIERELALINVLLPADAAVLRYAGPLNRPEGERATSYPGQHALIKAEALTETMSLRAARRVGRCPRYLGSAYTTFLDNFCSIPSLRPLRDRVVDGEYVVAQLVGFCFTSMRLDEATYLFA
jgi:hypothetical protein